MKNVLGLDLGTNSIGWALVQMPDEENVRPNIRLGSRIIPMSQDVLSKFESGVTTSQTQERTSFRQLRRIRERYLLRRERLFRVLHVLGFLPPHFDAALGWDRANGKTYGKFQNHDEPKIAWQRDSTGKNRFLFMDSFGEMLCDFQKHQPQLVADGKQIPLDWTLYYLRHKALQAPVSRQELAWILLSFNQKRGYYQLRGEEEEEDTSKRVEFMASQVMSVEETGRSARNVTYNIYLENGCCVPFTSKASLKDWVGLTKEFIVTTSLKADGSPQLDENGKVMRTYSILAEDNYASRKQRTEAAIEESGLTVGSYIYQYLLKHPEGKVIGKLVRTIDRRYYKEELRAILTKQAQFIPELASNQMLEACIRELYPRNEAHQQSLRRKDLVNLIIEDLLFYQRPLKSKKHLIANCPFEHYEYLADHETGELKIQPIKCIAKSHPLYQEFRLWQFVQNLRLFNRMDINEEEVTELYLPDVEARVSLFNYLNDLKDITQEKLLKGFFHLKKPSGKDSQFPLRWNYVEDKVYPCNETRYVFLTALKRVKMKAEWLTPEREQHLWHLLYSVDDRVEITKALTHWAEREQLSEEWVESFRKIPPFQKEYGAYSEKAIKKLLSVMRMGSRWDEQALPANLLDNYQSALSDESQSHVLERMGGTVLSKPSDFQGLSLWQACYAIYGRHSEAKDTTRWTRPEDIDAFLHGFKQHSLRNPIVEQCVLETLRTVRDVWKEVGQIDEIHVEMGRSMKSTAAQRDRMSRTIRQNEDTNLRIKLLLEEMKEAHIEDVRPYSPMHQTLMRIYEEGALQQLKKDSDDYQEIASISRKAQATPSEIHRYRLWLEQKYCSPYTGQPISFSKLFTSAYEIEHVIPKSRFYDDSFTNKVICEAEVNKLKSNQLGYEFIKNHKGQTVHCPALGDVRIFTPQEYEAFVRDHYSGNKTKAQKLMMDDIPETFVQRQLNDSRYISRLVLGLLSHLVRDEDEVDAISRHVIPCTGAITDKLKKDWGLNDVWNSMVTPRFERMNRLTNSDHYGYWDNKDGKRVFQTTMPTDEQRGFSKKRIDHRHHALDALAIALASRSIVSYLNNVSAHDTCTRQDLRRKLCGPNQTILKPWPTLTQDVSDALHQIVVSFKHQVRVINRASNHIERYDESGRKRLFPQTGARQWAIRKSLHKDTVFGHVNLRQTKAIAFNAALDQVSQIVDRQLRQQIRQLQAQGLDKKKIKAWFAERDFVFNEQSVKKVEVYYFTDDKDAMVAVRKPLDSTFTEATIAKITDTGIQRILRNYLAACDGNSELAFSPEGIEQLNSHIAQYNGGKDHKPILRVRLCEPMGEKFTIGESGNKARKYAEAQKGTNLYLGVYEKEDGQRSVATIPLRLVVERLKQGLSPVPETDEQGAKLRFWLSPNDLVYLPTEDERQSPSIDKLEVQRIYKFVSCTGREAYFLPHHVATIIKDGAEFQKLNKIQTTEDKVNIARNCWKLEVDRLGNIVRIIR